MLVLTMAAIPSNIPLQGNVQSTDQSIVFLDLFQTLEYSCLNDIVQNDDRVCDYKRHILKIQFISHY